MNFRQSRAGRTLLTLGLLSTTLLISKPSAHVIDAAAPQHVVAILTPYLTAPTTHQMVGYLQKDAQTYGWKTTVVTSDNDIATLASKMEDVISTKVGAIMIVHTDLSLLKHQIVDANKAGIPVFGVGTLEVKGVAASVSSNSDQMSTMATMYLFKRLAYKGNVVVLTYTPQPEVNERTKQFYRLVKQYPGIHVVTQQQVDVSSMVQSGNQIMANLLTANPKPGSITGVWCGWDDPAIGAAQAIKAAHRSDVFVTGIDGSGQGVSMIKHGSAFIATVKQQFDTQATMIVAQVARVFAGKGVTATQLFAPATLVTR